MKTSKKHKAKIEFLKNNNIILVINTLEEAKKVGEFAQYINPFYTPGSCAERFDCTERYQTLAFRFEGGDIGWGDAESYSEHEIYSQFPQYTLQELDDLVVKNSQLVKHMREYFSKQNDEIIVVCETQRQRDLLAAICGVSFQHHNSYYTAYRIKQSVFLGYDSQEYYLHNVSYAPMHTFNEWVRKSGYVAPQKNRKQWLKPRVIREIIESIYLAIQVSSVEELTNAQCILYDTLNLPVDRNAINQKMSMLWQQYQPHTLILISMYKTGVIDFISPSRYDGYKVLDVCIPTYKPTAPRKAKIAISPPRKQQLHDESAEIVKSLICHTEEVDQNDCCVMTLDQLWELLNAYKTQMFTAYPTEVDGLYIVRHETMCGFGMKQCLYNPCSLTFTSDEARKELTPSTILPQASYIHYDGENFTIVEVYCPKTVGYAMFNNQWILGQENDSRELLERWLAL